VEWEGHSYAQAADPQLRWGRAVLERRRWRGDETVIDAGCGPGTLTQELVARVPRGHVYAIDVDASMVAQARQRLRQGNVEVVEADLVAFVPPRPVEVVFSNAVFHWVLDHDALFRHVHAQLGPGGQLLAQCGGKGNVANVYERAARIASGTPFAVHFTQWQPVWRFEDAATTRQRLERCGFQDVHTDLEPAPLTFESATAYERFARAAPLRPFLTRLPTALREAFVARYMDAVVRQDDLVMDYVRLNMMARRA